MDGNIYLVILLVDNADDFLISLFYSAVSISCGGRNTDKTGKLADTEIYMHNEVAGFHFLQFLHGESHLALLGTLTLKLVLVETLKNLVVGK